jgi:hypothetical protein
MMLRLLSFVARRIATARVLLATLRVGGRDRPCGGARRLSMTAWRTSNQLALGALSERAQGEARARARRAAALTRRWRPDRAGCGP